MTQDEIKQCQSDWEWTEMSDLSSDHLAGERLRIYRKWFAKMLDHVQGRNQAPWMTGIREDDTAIRKVIEQD